MQEQTKTDVTLEIIHMRNGRVIEHVKPYSEASLLDRVLFYVGLKNLTRSA